MHPPYTTVIPPHTLLNPIHNPVCIPQRPHRRAPILRHNLQNITASPLWASTPEATSTNVPWIRNYSENSEPIDVTRVRRASEQPVDAAVLAAASGGQTLWPPSCKCDVIQKVSVDRCVFTWRKYYEISSRSNLKRRRLKPRPHWRL